MLFKLGRALLTECCGLELAAGSCDSRPGDLVGGSPEGESTSAKPITIERPHQYDLQGAALLSARTDLQVSKRPDTAGGNVEIPAIVERLHPVNKPRKALSCWLGYKVAVDKILVIGATGQLGTAAVEQLKSRQFQVRALVRDDRAAKEFHLRGVEPVRGDLRDPASLSLACQGVAIIIATANAALPTRKMDTFRSVDLLGYENLIRIAREMNVRRFIYTSALLSKHTRLSPFLQYKRKIEENLIASGLQHVIFRADIFMDTAFTMMGSTVPIRGARAATVLRKFGFANQYFSKIKDSIQDKHVALIPGDGSTHHAFICIADVASFLVAAISGPTGVYSLGGPQELSFLDVVRIYETILGMPLQVKRTPAAIFRIATTVLRLFSPAGSNLMCLNYIAATESSRPDQAVAGKFGVSLTSAEAFLRSKAAMATSA